MHLGNRWILKCWSANFGRSGMYLLRRVCGKKITEQFICSGWDVHSSLCPHWLCLAGSTATGIPHSRKFLQHWSCFWTHSNSLSIISKAPEIKSFCLSLNQFLQSINTHFICHTQSDTIPPPLSLLVTVGQFPSFYLLDTAQTNKCWGHEHLYPVNLLQVPLFSCLYL